jgi:hypothetical protein
MMAATMRGILWRVNVTWANRGKVGETETIVAATDAITALQIAWNSEDDGDLRTVEVEWLSPVECVFGDCEESEPLTKGGA